jgi:hypothetical protein
MILGIISLNSVNQLIFVMVKCSVLFEVRTGFLSIIKSIVGFERLTCDVNENLSISSRINIVW